MPLYLWSGKNPKGVKKKGEMEASSPEIVRASLKRMKLESIKIKPKPKDLFENIAFLQPKVKTADIILFAKQFSTMIDAGLTLAESLKKYPKEFDNLFVNMIAAGEAGGILDTILRRLSTYMEKAAKLKSKVKGAMTYPLVTLAIAIIVLAIILVFVIPVFQDMFDDFGESLPAFTQLVVDVSNFTKKNLLRLPVIGELIRKVAVAKFTSTMGTMLSSGVAILEALEIVAKTAGNKTIENAIYVVRSDIAEGRTMADPLLESGVFPAMVCQMIAVGESTGALDAMLEKIAIFYDEEVDQAVENLTSLIEPFMLVLGVTIGGLVIAMYLPVFKMAGTIGG
jgi:type IV pilus assembly protein PilC